uniref:MBL fold metallo-hydrolase n=1 Tax=Aquipuribacter hungaricus TaxID=545624 RepID=UPI0030EC60BC
MTRLVRADNPGPMTLEGTNTWLVGRERVLVVDPGPADPAHLAAVLAAVAGAGALGGVLLTHRHPDHADALGHDVLRSALASARAPVLALDPALGDPPTPGALAAATDGPA